MLIPFIRDDYLEIILIYVAAINNRGLFTMQHVEEVIQEEFKDKRVANMYIRMMKRFVEDQFETNSNSLSEKAKLKNIRRCLKKVGWTYSLMLLDENSIQVCVNKIFSMLIELEAYISKGEDGKSQIYIRRKDKLYLSEEKTCELWIWAESNKK